MRGDGRVAAADKRRWEKRGRVWGNGIGEEGGKGDERGRVETRRKEERK